MWGGRKSMQKEKGKVKKKTKRNSITKQDMEQKENHTKSEYIEQACTGMIYNGYKCSRR